VDADLTLLAKARKLTRIARNAFVLTRLMGSFRNAYICRFLFHVCQI